MAHIEWNEVEHATGVPEIDRRHGQLMELANALASSIPGLEGGPIQSRILELFGFSFYHFRTEERLMAKRMMSEADIDAHARAHDSISEYLPGLLRDFGNGIAIDHHALITVFLERFEHHEKAFDAKDIR
jgi:hemerythrin-like metal-binding protein